MHVCSSSSVLIISCRSFLARTGVLSSVVDGVARFVPGYQSGSGRAIPAISALYVFWTYGASGALSAAGQAMGRKEGLDLSHPRKYVNQLNGLPLRLFSAHQGLMENFGAFALAAALAQYLAPNDREILNLVGYSALIKLFVYYPAYIFDIGLPRTMAHISANGAIINILWRLAAASN